MLAGKKRAVFNCQRKHAWNKTTVDFIRPFRAEESCRLSSFHYEVLFLPEGPDRCRGRRRTGLDLMSNILIPEILHLTEQSFGRM